MLKKLLDDSAFLEKISFAGNSSNSGSVSSKEEEPKAEVKKEEPKVEKTQFDLYLKGFDSKAKLTIIKEIRGILNLGLKEVV